MLNQILTYFQLYNNIKCKEEIFGKLLIEIKNENDTSNYIRKFQIHTLFVDKFSYQKIRVQNCFDAPTAQI